MFSQSTLCPVVFTCSASADCSVFSCVTLLIVLAFEIPMLCPFHHRHWDRVNNASLFLFGALSLTFVNIVPSFSTSFSATVRSNLFNVHLNLAVTFSIYGKVTKLFLVVVDSLLALTWDVRRAFSVLFSLVESWLNFMQVFPNSVSVSIFFVFSS